MLVRIYPRPDNRFFSAGEQAADQQGDALEPPSPQSGGLHGPHRHTSTDSFLLEWRQHDLDRTQPTYPS